MAPSVRFNHLGITVTDIARARRFYEGLLGFKFWWDFDVPDDLSAKTMMLDPPVGLIATYLWHPDLTLNLMYFGAQQARDRMKQRQLTEPGLTHIALSVEDLEGTLGRVPEFGGEVLHESMGPPSDWGTAVWIRDSEGQLIELVTMKWREQLSPPPG
jgi:lactoylglutathione lyase